MRSVGSYKLMNFSMGFGSFESPITKLKNAVVLPGRLALRGNDTSN